MSSSVSDVRARSRGVREILPQGERKSRLRRIRAARDVAARIGVAAGGLGVIGALALIFFYLLYEVAPIFGSASVTPQAIYAVPGGPAEETLHVALERYLEVGSRFTRSGAVLFFEAGDGTLRARTQLPVGGAEAVTSFATAEARTGLVAYGLADGHGVVARHAYRITYPNDVRHIEPVIEYPLGEAPLVIDAEGAAITHLAVQEGRQGLALVAATADRRLLLVRYNERTNFMTGEKEVRREAHTLPWPMADAGLTDLLLDSRMSSLFVGDDRGRVHYYDVSAPARAHLADSVPVTGGEGGAVTAMEFLLGTVSLIVGGADGSVSQWFLVRDGENVNHLTRIRTFEGHGAPVVAIAAEHQRKGFATADADGGVKLHYPAGQNTTWRGVLSEQGVSGIALAPRHNGLLLADAQGQLRRLAIDNPHPEVSLSALWEKVWYEGRGEPDYIWQSSSATDEFEPKFSLVPLSVGTIKAAFYAMLFAMPLAIMGAIYSAYFMSPKLRGKVKPTIEIMEALPTVILGFLAGLWLAPFVENNLPAVFSVLLLMPLGMLALALLWTRGPKQLRHLLPPGWEVAVLIPLVLLVGWVSVAASPYVEIALFSGDMRQWFTDVGIPYDQRNALVVGIAMGFAVIPTIFSIAEDAIFNVPKHLSQGSLALGATPWQTMTGVVLLTASPGIFAAVMIGFGRAVGETMIVLMATGNSPVVNFNIFEGMRTLSANIAVEMGETAVGSSHYRILFLAALVLFGLTFIINTVAELVRQRLRAKYSTL